MALIGVVVAASIVAAAVGLGPMLLAPGSTAPENPPAPLAIVVPTWTTGDTWTYNISYDVQPVPLAVAPLLDPPAMPSVHGNVTKEVVGTVLEGTAYNVTVVGAFEIDGTIPGHDGIPVTCKAAQVEGYTWYRTADLARLLDVRTLVIEGGAYIMDHEVQASFTVITETMYEPPWDAWSFPLEEHELWTVDTSATVHGVAIFRVEWPTGWLEYGKRFSFTVPVKYEALSNGFEDVETPAGIFHALRVSLYPSLDVAAMSQEVALAVGVTGDAVPMITHGAVDVWFSEDVGNVVRFLATVTGEYSSHRLEVVLVEYHRA